MRWPSPSSGRPICPAGGGLAESGRAARSYGKFCAPHLERADSAGHHGAQHVVRVELLLQQPRQNLVDESGFGGLGWAIFEVLLSHRRLHVEFGQVEGIAALRALHIKEGPLPLLHRVQPLDLGKGRVASRRDANRAAGHQRFGGWTRNGVFAKTKEFGPQFNCGPQTEVAFAEGREGGHRDDGICWEMMRLEAEEVKK